MSATYVAVHKRSRALSTTGCLMVNALYQQVIDQILPVSEKTSSAERLLKSFGVRGP
jgi:hypothetical protein